MCLCKIKARKFLCLSTMPWRCMEQWRCSYKCQYKGRKNRLKMCEDYSLFELYGLEKNSLRHTGIKPRFVAHLVCSLTTILSYCCKIHFNPLNAELNPICHLLALLGGATIVVVSRLRVNVILPLYIKNIWSGHCMMTRRQRSQHEYWC